MKKAKKQNSALVRFEEWLRDGGRTGSALSASTIATYVRVARLIVEAKKPEKILRKDLSTSTKLKYLAVLRQWASFIEDDALERRLAPGPELQKMLNLRESKLPEKVEAFDEGEVEAFLEVLDRLKVNTPDWAYAWVWPCVSLQIHLGLRVGVDLAGLQRASVRAALRTKKLAVMGKREGIDYLPAGFVKEELEALVAIPKWKIVADLISPDTRDMDFYDHALSAYRIYRDVLITLGKSAGIDASRTHRFRHWAITNFIRNVAKGDMKRAQRFARHKSIETTLRYYRTVDLEEDDQLLADLKRGR